MDKSTLGAGSKQNIFYIALRDWGEDVATTAMWRLARITNVFNTHQSISLGLVDVMASPHLVKAKEEMLNIQYV